MANIIGICLICALIGVKVGVALRLLSQEKSHKGLVHIAGIGGVFAVLVCVVVPAVFGGTANTAWLIAGIASGTIGAAVGGVICDIATSLLTPRPPEDKEKKDKDPPE